MKTFYAITFILISWTAKAQFSVDYSNPFAICDASSEQSGVRHLSDGNGGHFLFWLDKRTDGVNKELYGQHLDAFGIPQWIPNGKLIVSFPGKTIVTFTCKNFDGGILLAWYQSASGYGDSLQVKKIDANGNDVWNEPTTIAVMSGTLGMAGAVELMPNDSGSFITYSMIYIGGSAAMEFNRVDFNGNRHWPTNSNAQTVNGYDYRSCSDGLNGIYILGKGNGLGSQMFIQRFNLQGNSVFPPTDITNGGLANGFAGNISLMNDEDGNLYCLYDANNYRVQVSKIDSSGNVIHAALKVADYIPQSAQFYSYARLINGNLYACWNDDRNGTTHVFAQKMDTSCAPIWSIDGIDVAATNLYCRSELAMSDSNAIVVYHVKPGIFDASLQRIREDSSLTWVESYSVGNSPGGSPTDGDVDLADDAGGCNAVFWATQGNMNVYGAKLCSNGQLISVQELKSNASSINVYPNPASDYLNIDLENSAHATVRIFDVVGNLVLTSENNLTIDVRSIESGIYVVEFLGKESNSFGKFIKQ